MYLSVFFTTFSSLTERNSNCRAKNKCHFLYRLWSRTKLRFSLDLWFLFFLPCCLFTSFFMLFFRYLNWSTFATSCCTREPSTLALTRKLRAPLQKKLRAQLERLTGARSAPVAPVHTVTLDAKTTRISFENQIKSFLKQCSLFAQMKSVPKTVCEKLIDFKLRVYWDHIYCITHLDPF